MITIQKVTEKDLEQLAGLYEELAEEKQDIRKLEDVFQKIDSNSDYFLAGAVDENGALLGSMMGILCFDAVSGCRPFLVIENVIVKSTCRGRGVGRMLMERLEAFAKEHDCWYAILVSSAARTGAHKFYESLGFDKDPVRGFRKRFTSNH